MTDLAALVSDNLGIWTSAIERKSGAGRGGGKRVNLYGIEQLRALILDLAVRGKLLAQNAKDEHASALIARSETALKASIAQESFRTPAKIQPSVAPEGIPENWVATRLGALVRVVNGRAYRKPELLAAGTPVLRVGNLFTSNEWYYSDLDLEADKYIDKGDLIYAWSASFGPFIWEGGRVIYHYHIWKLEPYSEPDISRDFLRLFLQNETSAIKASGHGIAMLHMTKERMEQLSLLLPPLAEQQRIVAKVDELMALCDALERESADAMAAHQALVETLLATLTSSTNAADLATNWARLETHFETLFTTDASIETLRQAILDLAVRGKLVEQSAENEPASVLLKKIVVANSKRVASGQSKAMRSNSASPEGKGPFALPSSWVWTSLGQVAFKLTDGAHHTPTYLNSGVPFLSVKDMSAGKLDFSDTRFISEAQHTELYKRCDPEFGDLLITKVGTTGVPVIVDTDKPFSLFVSVALVKAPWELLSVEFLRLMVDSPFVRKQSADGTQGIGNKNLVLRTIGAFLIPLPPLAEQHRIVAKVDALMALCDQLKTRLAEAAQTQRHLADAIVEQAAA